MNKKVVVTGGSGLLGPFVVKEFLEHGYDVLNVDTKLPREALCPTVITDLTQLGQAYGVLQGAHAVVHMAAIPVAYSHPNEVTFQNNVMSTYNILEAAAGLGIKRAVTASSESSYGIVFAVHPFSPQYVPIDEDHPQLPQDAYGLSKIVNEKTGDMFYQQTGMQVVSFRIGNIITPAMYKRFPEFIHQPEERERILWSYVDARDVASACRLAVECDGRGSIAINLAADDTSMDVKSRDLMRARYPDVTDFRESLDGFETLLSNKLAKERLGWQPVYSWREEVEKTQ